MAWPKGNGPGWGGPAKGPGNGSPKHPDFKAGETHNPQGRGAFSVKGLARKERIERWREALDQIAMDETQPAPARVNALNSLLDRDEGKPAQKIEQSGPGGGPLVVEVVKFGRDK